MKPIVPSHISRRVLLSTIATLPVLSTLRTVPASAQTTTSGGVLPSWNEVAQNLHSRSFLV